MYTQQQTILHPEKPAHQLQCFSDTWWACRFSAVNAICSTYDVILASLHVAEGFPGAISQSKLKLGVLKLDLNKHI